MKENIKVIFQAIIVIGCITFGILCLLVFGAAGLSWYYLLIPLSAVMFSILILSIFKIYEKDDIDNVSRDPFEEEELVIDVRFTDQKIKKTKLQYGGGGQILFARDYIHLIGMDHYSNEAGELALNFIPLGSAINTLQKERQKPTETTISIGELKGIIYDPFKGRFVILYSNYSFPFCVLKNEHYDTLKISSFLQDYYPDLLEEGKMPIEHKRPLIMFAILLCLAIPILFALFVYPGIAYN